MSEEEWGASGWAVTWRGLSVSVGGRRVVSGMTGGVRSGRLVALMGPSGAGKSSLMEALGRRSGGDVMVEGEVRVFGTSGFVHQEEVFVGALTVREHLMVMGRLKLGRRGSGGGALERAVERVMGEMGLTGCAERRIGGGGGGAKEISGGERKRVAMATEVLTEPEILFCDEPTTGLDSFSAQQLVGLMKQMTSRGKSILCTVHQPSSEVFAMFQEVILVAEGRTAFMGDAEGAVRVLERYGFGCPRNYNPVEVMMEALSKGREGVTVKRICEEYSESERAKRMEEMLGGEAEGRRSGEERRRESELGRRRSSWMWTLLWLSYRSFLQVLREPSVQGVRILQKLGIALMAGLCFYGSVAPTQAGVQSVQGAVFILVTENTFPPMYGLLPLFPEEFPLFLREHRSHLYSPHLYYIAKTISLLPGLILEPLLFVALAYLISGLRRTLSAFLATAAIAVLTTNVAAACGSFFSNAFPSPAVALAFLVPVDYALMATSGLFAKLTSLPPPVAWLRHLSWFMYANEALTILQWDGVTNITCDSRHAHTPCLSTGADVLRHFDFSPSRLPHNLIAMALLYCLFHLLAYLSLRSKANKNSSRR